MDYEEIIAGIKGRRIVVIGDLMIDRYDYRQRGKQNPEDPIAPLLIRTGKIEDRLGGAGNVAANLASLGASVHLFGLIGKDEAGESLMKECERRGINFHQFCQGRTNLKERIMVGKRQFSRTDLPPAEECGVIDEQNANGILLEVKAIIGNIDAIIFSDYDKVVCKSNLAQEIIKEAMTLGKPVFVDCKPVNVRKFSGATLLKINEKEARGISGKEDIGEVIKEVAETSLIKYIVVTLGAKGSVVYDGQAGFVPTAPKEEIDVTGAGDTALAALCLSMVSGANLHEAATFANAAAGVVVEKSGTATLTIEELAKRVGESLG